MNTIAQATPETLPLITWQGLPVITTELLANVYGSDVKNIQMNFSNNVSRFIEGVHYFVLKGIDLKEFKLQPNNIGLQISNMVRKLYLWTERGTVRHAKILDTDNAWAVQDRLEDSYFAKNQPQYGLKQLPPSPYISEPEAAQFMKSIQAHCKSNGGKYSALYKKVYDYYGITSYKHIPAGKLEEAARLCGMKLMKLVKSKIPDEIPLLTFTQDELDTLIAERIKAIEGELLPKETEPAEPGEKHFLIKIKGDQQTIEPVDSNCYYMTEERFICHLKNSGRVVFDKTGVSARQIVMHHIPPQFLPDMIEEAWAMLRRIEAEKIKA